MKRKITMVALILFFMVTCSSLKGQKVSASTEGDAKTAVADSSTWYARSLKWYNNNGTALIGDASLNTEYITSDGKISFTVIVDGAAAKITKINVLDGSAKVVIPRTIKLFYLKEDSINGVLADSVSYNGTDSWSWTNTTKKYVPTTNVGLLTVTSIATSFSGNLAIAQTWIKEVNIPSTITKIDANAFIGNENLESVVMTGVKEVGANAFSGCTSLTKVLFGQNLQTLDAAAFKGCNGLLKIDLTGDDGMEIGTDSSTNTIADIPIECFSGCTNLKDIRVSNRVVNIRSKAFYQCKLSEFKFEVTQIKVIEASAFAQCNGLDYVALPDVINSIGKDAFINCENLRYVYIPKTLTLTDTIVEATKLINGKDSTAPVLYKDGAEVKDGSYVYSPGTFYVGDTLDIKKDTYDLQNNLTYDAVIVKRDGINVADSVVKYSVNGGYNINTYCFYIPQGQYGTYTVQATDILGNTATRTFYYKSDAVDVKAPTVNIKTGKYYKSKSVQIKYSDASKISSAKLNGKSIASGKKITKAGKYTFIVADMFGNVKTIKFTIDRTAPTVKGISKKKTVKVGKAVTFSDKYGVKSATLNGKKYVNGKVIKKAGKYKLVITDKAGNKKTISFKVVK